MLTVEFDGSLKGSVTDNVSVREVFSEDATSRLLFLGDLVAVAVGVRSMRGTVIDLTVGGGYGDLSTLELGVIQKLGSLGGSLLLERDAGIFGVALAWSDLDLGDFAAILVSKMFIPKEVTTVLPETEEILNFFVFRLDVDVLD